MNILPGNIWKDARKLRAEKRNDILIKIGKHKEAIVKLEKELEQFPCVRCGREGCAGGPEMCDKCQMWTKEYNVAVANNLIVTAKQIARRIDAHHCQ